MLPERTVKDICEYGGSWAARDRRAWMETPSGPDAFLAFCLINRRLTSCSWMVKWRGHERGVIRQGRAEARIGIIILKSTVKSVKFISQTRPSISLGGGLWFMPSDIL